MPPKRPRVEYTEEALAEALYDVTDEGLSVRMAAQKWAVPRVTISDRLHGIGAVEPKGFSQVPRRPNYQDGFSKWSL